jgi:hypothetical protein|uniref:Uncharacterized protein n=1 Tax=Picea glauca TaxID=3330 RepID=A0A101M3U4_PICGL|nr:hypothetical protein ABT39_MTgene301 [Picea glauca]
MDRKPLQSWMLSLGQLVSRNSAIAISARSALGSIGGSMGSLASFTGFG